MLKRLAILLAAVLAPRPALAQDSFALERFQPAPAGDRWLGLPSPYVAGDLTLHAALLADYGYRPLVLKAPPATPAARISHQAVLHANVTLALWQRWLLNVDVPALSLQSGETTPPPHTADFGDVRLGTRARLIGDNGTPFQLGVGGYLWLPSATGASSGDGAVRGMPYASLGGLAGRILWSALLGAEFRPFQRYQGHVAEGISLDAGAGIGYLVDEPRRWQLGLESSLSFVVADPSAHNLNAELLLSARYRFLEQLEAALGAGPGLSHGVGTPTLRGVLLLAYVPVADLSPPRPPAPPEHPSVAADSLVARSVRLAQLQAVASDSRCCSVTPSEPKPATINESPSKLPDSILFDTGSALIGPQAERALHALADYLIAHPEIRQVELAGYADIHGTAQSNERLGAQRALAVKHLLVRHSVAPERLQTKSYGAAAPAAPSTTSAGMQRNRRVTVRFIDAPAQ